MATSLLKISAKAVAEEICKGNLKNFDYNLNNFLSNLVFYDEICEKKNEITNEVFEEVLKKLNISKISLTRKVSERLNVSSISNFRLKTLVIKGFEPLRIKYPMKENPEATIDIVALLNDLLGAESKKVLKNLEFYGYTETFSNGWIAQIAPSLPSIQNLDIGGNILSQINFNDLCANFVNLTVLQLSCSKVASLHGISALEHLLVLGICDMDFNSKDDIMDVFQLKKLQNLEIAGWQNRNVLTFQQYMECQKSLPELIQLDCSRNVVSEELIRILAETHPKLELVSLIDTNCRSFPLPKVKLLTTTSLKDCALSLKHYYPFGCCNLVGNILNELLQIIQNNYEKYSEDDIRECLEPVLKSLEVSPKIISNTLAGIQCLSAMCIDKRAKMFSIKEKHIIVKAFINSCLDFPDRKYNNSIHGKIWNIFRFDDVIRTPYLNFFEIYCLALEDIRFFSADLPTTIHCMIVMSKIVSKCGRVKLETLDKPTDHLAELTNRLQYYFNSQNLLFYSWCLKLISKYVKLFPEKLLHIKSTAKSLMDHWCSVQDENNLKAELLDALTQIVILLDLYDTSVGSRINSLEICSKENLKSMIQSTAGKSVIAFVVSLFLYNRPETIKNYAKTRNDFIENVYENVNKYSFASLEQLTIQMNRSSNNYSSGVKDWNCWIMKRLE